MSAGRIVRRVIFLVVLSAVAGFFLMGGVAKLTEKDKPPSSVDAPFIIQTASRIYYAREITFRGETPMIRAYWELNGRHYTFHDAVLEFPRKIFGTVAIVRRTKG